MLPWTHYRAQVAALSRARKADDPELVAAKQNLRAARLADHVARVVADAPPLTSEQRHRIAQLLAPNVVVGGGGAA